MSYGICPACGQDILFQDTVQIGQSTVCPRCHELLAIVTLNPIILEMYKHSTYNGILPEEKKETGKKNNLKIKNHFGELEDQDDKEEDWRKALRKSRSRKVNDW